MRRRPSAALCGVGWRRPGHHGFTAPPEARSSTTDTRPADYTFWRDDQVSLVYETLPKGTYDVVFRTRASTPGAFIQPPARAAQLYQAGVHGNGNGALVRVAPKADR